MARAILIDATTRELRVVACNGAEDIRALLGGWLEAACQLPSGDVLYVDEEGLLKPQTGGFLFALRPDQPLMGHGVLVGPELTNDEGEYIGDADVRTPIVLLRRLVRFVDRAYIDAWGRANASEPAASVTTLGPDGEPETTALGRWGQTIADMPKPEGNKS
jgi:hypothetical protein